MLIPLILKCVSSDTYDEYDEPHGDPYSWTRHRAAMTRWRDPVSTVWVSSYPYRHYHTSNYREIPEPAVMMVEPVILENGFINSPYQEEYLIPIQNTDIYSNRPMYGSSHVCHYANEPIIWEYSDMNTLPRASQMTHDQNALYGPRQGLIRYP